MSSASLHALHGFVAVARSLSFSTAARSLGVSPSALSQTVRRLEEELGVTLLHRTSRRVALTDEGRQLLAAVGPALDQAFEALALAVAHPDEIVGGVRLCAPSVAVELVLHRLLPQFHRDHPRVEVDVRIENALVDLEAAQADAGIRLISAIEPDMAHVRVHGPLRLVVVGAPDYLARKGIPRRPEDLLDHDCIGLRFSTHGPPFAWELGEGEATIQVPVTGPAVTNDRALMRSLALSGVGLLYTLEAMVADHLAAGRLQIVLEDYVQHFPGLFLYYPARAQISPALRAFIETAQSLFESPEGNL